MKVKLDAVKARDYKLVIGFHLKGWEIEVLPDRNPKLPPLVEREWQHGHIKGDYQDTCPEKRARESSYHVVTIGREEDGEIHCRKSVLSYERRPSKVGGKVVQCKSWASETHDHERLAAALGFETLAQLQESLVTDGIPGKSTCLMVASELDRSLGSVTGKLRHLRKKALASRE